MSTPLAVATTTTMRVRPGQRGQPRAPPPPAAPIEWQTVERKPKAKRERSERSERIDRSDAVEQSESTNHE
jgi:hypothetical protein